MPVNPDFLRFISARTNRPADLLASQVEQKAGLLTMHGRKGEETVRVLADLFQAQAPPPGGGGLLDGIDRHLSVRDLCEETPQAPLLVKFLTEEANSDLRNLRGEVHAVESNPEHTLLAVEISDFQQPKGTMFVHAAGTTLEWYIHSNK